MSLANKSPKETYPDLLYVDNSGSGITSTKKPVNSGNGNVSCLELGTNSVRFIPQASNTTTAFVVKVLGSGSDGNAFQVDTENRRVLCGASQNNALTLMERFTVTNLTPVAGYHHVMGLGSANYSASGLTTIKLGNSTDPAGSLDISSEVDTSNFVNSYWYIPGAIRVIEAHILVGGSAASSAQTLNFHLMSYAMDTSTNYGDLSDGTVVLSSNNITDANEDVIKYISMTGGGDVAQNRILVATIESSGTEVCSANMLIKYHLQ